MSFLDFAAIKQQVFVRSAIDLLGLRLTEHRKPMARAMPNLQVWRRPCAGDHAIEECILLLCSPQRRRCDRIGFAHPISRHERGRSICWQGMVPLQKTARPREPAMVTTSSPRRGQKRTSEASSLLSIRA